MLKSSLFLTSFCFYYSSQYQLVSAKAPQKMPASNVFIVQYIFLEFLRWLSCRLEQKYQEYLLFETMFRRKFSLGSTLLYSPKCIKQQVIFVSAGIQLLSNFLTGFIHGIRLPNFKLFLRGKNFQRCVHVAQQWGFMLVQLSRCCPVACRGFTEQINILNGRIFLAEQQEVEGRGTAGQVLWRLASSHGPNHTEPPSFRCSVTVHQLVNLARGIGYSCPCLVGSIVKQLYFVFKLLNYYSITNIDLTLSMHNAPFVKRFLTCCYFYPRLTLSATAHLTHILSLPKITCDLSFKAMNDLRVRRLPHHSYTQSNPYPPLE